MGAGSGGGGSASRFGRNKLEAVVDGKSLLRRSLEAVPAEEFAQVTVVTQYDAAAALAEETALTVEDVELTERGDGVMALRVLLTADGESAALEMTVRGA